MKKLSLLIAMLVFCLHAQAQPGKNSSNVPDNVRAKFTNQNPTATPTWKTEGQNYSAWYTDPQTNMQRVTVYDKDGRVVRSESEMDVKNYPAAISGYYNQNYPNEKDYKVWQTYDPAAGDTVYYTKTRGKTMWFDKEGKFTPGNNPPKK
jgi:hypothetical protein